MSLITPQKIIDLEQGVNQGVVAPTPQETQVAGELDMSQFPIIAPDSNIDKFLSDFDAQFNLFDTLGCNIFSSIGQSEVDLNSKGENKIELSERYACVKAGLNGNSGSSEQQWENAVNNYGLVLQSVWPWNPGISKEEYFKSIPDDITTHGRAFLQKYEPFHRTVGTDIASLKEALKYGAVKIFVGTGPGWNVAEPNVVPVNPGAMNHAVMLRKIDSLGLHIRDQYPPFLKVLAPTYKIFYAFQTLYKKKVFAYKFTKNLQYGTTDPDCIFLQMALVRDLGVGEFPYDQHFGQKTLNLVQRFQVKYGIAQPGVLGFGIFGPLTRSKLNSLLRF